MAFPAVVLLLAAAAVVVDDPSRWTTGPGLLRHAAWDGVRPADFATPVFLFFLGAAIPTAGGNLKTGVLLITSALLFAAGLAVNGVMGPGAEGWRLTGVLQRAGVALAGAGLALSAAADDYRARMALLGSISGFLMLTYWLVMAHVPPPGGVAGDLSASGNLAAWVDRAVLGRHAWSAQWDPDGVLSTLSSISTVLAGVVAAIAATSQWRGARTMLQLIAAGVAAIVGGLLATVAVPINRTLWSGPFVLVSSGVALILLAPVVWMQQRR